MDERKLKISKLCLLHMLELPKLEFDTRNKSWAFSQLVNNVLDRVGFFFWLHNAQKMAQLVSNGVNLQNFQVSKG